MKKNTIDLYLITGNEDEIGNIVEKNYGKYKLDNLDDFMSEFNTERIYLIPELNTMLRTLITDSDSVMQLAGDNQEVSNIKKVIENETKLKLKKI